MHTYQYIRYSEPVKCKICTLDLARDIGTKPHREHGSDEGSMMPTRATVSEDGSINCGGELNHTLAERRKKI